MDSHRPVGSNYYFDGHVAAGRQLMRTDQGWVRTKDPIVHRPSETYPGPNCCYPVEKGPFLANRLRPIYELIQQAICVH